MFWVSPFAYAYCQKMKENYSTSVQLYLFQVAIHSGDIEIAIDRLLLIA